MIEPDSSNPVELRAAVDASHGMVSVRPVKTVAVFAGAT